MNDNVTEEQIDRQIQLISQNMYSDQTVSSKRRKHPAPAYTLAELREWLNKQPNTREIFRKWMESGFYKWLRPSIDRIDKRKPYSLDNMQLTTRGINVAKGKLEHTATKKGEDPSKIDISKIDENDPQYTPLIQFTFNGKEITRYRSTADAVNLSSVKFGTLHSCANQTQWTAGGFIWIKEKDYTNELLNKIVNKVHETNLDIDVHDLNGNYLRTFNIIPDAAKELNLDIDSIRMCANKELSTYGGYIFVKRLEKDKDQYIKDIVATIPIDVRSKVGVIITPYNKPIERYDTTGKYIATYKNIREASNASGVTQSYIYKCANDEIARCKNNLWMYTDDTNKEVKLKSIAPKADGGNVEMYKLDGTFVRSFKSASEASKILGISRPNISACIARRRTMAGDHLWLDGKSPDKETHLNKLVEELKPTTYVMYDSKGNLIKTFNGIEEAMSELKVPYKNLLRATKGHLLKDKDIVILDIKDPELKQKLNMLLDALHKTTRYKVKQPVNAYLDNGNLVKKYTSLKQAAIMNNSKIDILLRALDGDMDRCCKLVWKWRE